MPQLSDIEIARSARATHITRIAHTLGLADEHVVPYGAHMAKLDVPEGDPARASGKLILVTAMNGNPQGVGKTVTTIGLGQAFGRLGLRHCICLREPSIGPTLGIKGGGTGGGRAQIIPMEDINLHFTGDLHAVTSAHNLLSALVDNHVFFDNPLGIDPQQIRWPRVMDLCDRQLRHCTIGQGGRGDGFPHRTRFDISAGSEVMAALSLAHNRNDLEARLSRMIVAYDGAGAPVYARSIDAVGAMSSLLRHALKPNLVQTLERTPALVHCGPFANITHGCSSVVATRLALSRVDYVIAEAGFGADLGAEKFVHIKCRQANLKPAAAVLVVTCHALRFQGGVPDRAVHKPDVEAVQRGLENVRVHLENLRKLNLPPLVALNGLPEDSPAEVAAIADFCQVHATEFACSEAFTKGGGGATDLAIAVRRLSDQRDSSPLNYLYDPQDTLEDKLDTLAREVYRAEGVQWDDDARQDLERIDRHNLGGLPLCVSKTPLSLSDNPARRGAPRGFRLRVRGLDVSHGGGFVVVRTGNISRMPGMPRRPAAHALYMDDTGHIRGLY